MIKNSRRQEERTGKDGTPRGSIPSVAAGEFEENVFPISQELVTQFQNTCSEDSKERIVANLANFAYDPYNYTFLRQTA